MLKTKLKHKLNTVLSLDTVKERVKSHGLDLVLETNVRGWELFISLCTFASQLNVCVCVFLVLLLLVWEDMGKEYPEFLSCLILRLKQSGKQVCELQNSDSLDSLTRFRFIQCGKQSLNGH